MRDVADRRWDNILAEEKVGTSHFKQNPASLKVSNCVRENRPWLDLISKSPECKASILSKCWGHRIWAREHAGEKNQEKWSAGGLLEEDRRLFILSCNWLKLIILFPLLGPHKYCCTVRSKPCLDFLDNFMSEGWTKLFLQAVSTSCHLVRLLVTRW